jgi:hypothetical protein
MYSILFILTYQCKAGLKLKWNMEYRLLTITIVQYNYRDYNMGNNELSYVHSTLYFPIVMYRFMIYECMQVNYTILIVSTSTL